VTSTAEGFGQLITAMVSPFDENEDLDYQQAGLLAKRLVKNGSDSIVVSGTTGESPTLSTEEKIRLFRTVHDAVDGKAKIIGGTTNYSTRESIELTEEAAAYVDGYLLVVPYYNNPPQEGLFQHFRSIAASTDRPCILYNVPTRTVRNMEASTVVRLSEISNIVGVKEASGDYEQISNIINSTPGDFHVWSGNDQDTFSIMCLGGFGVVSVASHVVGNLIKKMIVATTKGDTEEGAHLHHELLPLAKALFPPVSPIASPSAIKSALNLTGFNVGGLRLPLLELPAEAKAALNLLLEEYEVDD